ncbi:hypothetical protein BS50DRAFT_592888 [Corynespora cassiicola Philippines]|uniref:Uncharacterized protein n=1 Tax=Corynespora cassiicola Philippines TaxID=1448308 RepID=A0A2T2N7Q2_CORCC|nr:hypothetical protein BS50DRAFT_592888 [Corynespora cassiicola Philippines]
MDGFPKAQRDAMHPLQHERAAGRDRRSDGEVSVCRAGQEDAQRGAGMLMRFDLWAHIRLSGAEGVLAACLSPRGSWRPSEGPPADAAHKRAMRSAAVWGGRERVSSQAGMSLVEVPLACLGPKESAVAGQVLICSSRCWRVRRALMEDDGGGGGYARFFFFSSSSSSSSSSPSDPTPAPAAGTGAVAGWSTRALPGPLDPDWMLEEPLDGTQLANREIGGTGGSRAWRFTE